MFRNIRTLLILLLLLAIVIGGSISSVLLVRHLSDQKSAGASAGTTSSPQHATPKHTVSYTSATYYQTLQANGTNAPATQTPTPSSNLGNGQPGLLPPAGRFSFSFSGQESTDASAGIPIKICVVTANNHAADGEDVYLTADNETSFLTNLVTLDHSGCASSSLFAPKTGQVTVYAAIDYITPAFDAVNTANKDAYHYPLPEVGKTQLDITTASPAIPPAIVFGSGHSSSPIYASVNLALGNYTYSHTDLALPVHSGSISMTRTYNSLDTSSGPLGIGWTFPYNQSLTIASNGVSIRYGDGHHEDYILKNGIYTPLTGSGNLNTLSKSSDTYIVLHKDQSQDIYDATGKLISLIDHNGNKLTFTYNGSLLTKVYDPMSGRGLGFIFNNNTSNGHIVNVFNLQDSSRSYAYAYDTDNHLIAVSDPLGNSTNYAYDSNNRLVTVNNTIGNTVITNMYDSSGRVIQQAKANGAITTFTYAPGKTTVTDPLNHKTVYTFDFFYRQVSITNPLSFVTDYTYDKNGELRTVIAGDGNTVEYQYDTNGNLLNILDAVGMIEGSAGGHTRIYSYDNQNHLLKITDANRNTTTYTYDARGNVLTATNTLSDVTHYSYNPLGQLINVTNPGGKQQTLTYGYDKFGDQITNTDNAGSTKTTTYNVDGLPVKVTDANGQSTTIVYDTDDHVQFTTDAYNHSVHYTYDTNGNRLSATDANGNTTSYVYDQLNRLEKVINPDNTFIQYFYDNDGNLIKQMDEAGHITTYSYDANNQVVKITDPLMHTTSYTFDGAGNVASKTDANGMTTYYNYDANNLLTGIHHADGSSVQYIYDGAGNRVAMVDSTGTTRYTFNQLNQLISVTDPSGHKLSMGYDANGNQTSLVYPDGRSVNYSYDNNNRLISVTDWNNNTTQYSYDAAGNLTKVSLPNQIITSYTYDADNRLVAISNAAPGGIISAYQYSFDAAGNPIQVTSQGSHTETGTTQYSYDDMNRLIQVSYPDGSTVFYSYGSTGNRSSMVKDVLTGKDANAIRSTSTYYSYNAANELTQTQTRTFDEQAQTQIGTTNTVMTYDNNGNMITSKTGASITAYLYNVQNELTSVTNGATTTRYAYNGDGFRISKAVTTGRATTSTQYVLSPTKIPQVLEEVSGKNVSDELYGLDQLATAPLSTTASPDYYSYDGSGNVRNMTDSNGNVLSSYNYDAFGGLRSSTGTKNEFQFNGQQTDAEDGLIYLRSRYYDPALGRFIMPDTNPGTPNSPQTLNYYTYANNNPISFADPTGQAGIDTIFAGIIGAIVGGAASIISQAISGKGINWAEVASDAVIGAAVGAALDLAPEAAFFLFNGNINVDSLKVAIQGIGGGIQGGTDYCFDACGSSKFNVLGLFTNVVVGTVSGAAFGKLGEWIDSGVESIGKQFGKTLSEFAGNVDNAVSLLGISFISQSPLATRTEAVVAALPEAIAQGIFGPIQNNISNTLASQLNQFNSNGANS